MVAALLGKTNEVLLVASLERMPPQQAGNGDGSIVGLGDEGVEFRAADGV